MVRREGDLHELLRVLTSKGSHKPLLITRSKAESLYKFDKICVPKVLIRSVIMRRLFGNNNK